MIDICCIAIEKRRESNRKVAVFVIMLWHWMSRNYSKLLNKHNKREKCDVN